MQELDKAQYLGNYLLEQGFAKWFKYMFRIIEERPFIHEAMHDSLFEFFQDLYDMQIIKGIINIPPRSAKTAMSVYFMAYGWCHNPKANYIYTSYSGDLVKDVSRMLVNILTNPKFQAMYPLDNVIEEDTKDEPIDSFWSQYADITDKKTQKKVFSAKFVRNEAGGQALFTQMGSAITGFGASIRGATSFSGGVIIDDGNKPQNIHSAIYTEKTNQFYAETLLSRLNNAKGFILNIQQRLHIANDITAFLLDKYSKFFKQLTRPLVENGVCLLPSQYTEERIEELKINEYVWQAQYQQNPILSGGNIIKQDWFCYYDAMPTQFDKVYQSWDTAYKTGQENDYSVCTTWGVVKTVYSTDYYLIDMWHGKVEYPQLIEKLISLYYKYAPNEVLIEDKASGQTLIQDLKQKGLKQVKPIKVDKDKVARVNNITELFYNGRVLFYDKANYLQDLQNELITFPSGKHDDIVDSISQFLNYMITRKTTTMRVFSF